MSPFTLVPRGPLGAAYVPILLSEVEQEQRPRGNGDREAIVVGAGFYDGEGERAYTAYAPQYDSRSTRGKQRTFSTQRLRSNSTAFHSIPAIQPKGSTSVLSTKKFRPIYSYR